MRKYIEAYFTMYMCCPISFAGRKCYTNEEDMEFTGDVHNDILHNVRTRLDCEYQCTNEVNCKAYVYYTDAYRGIERKEKDCVMLRRITKPKRSRGVTSGQTSTCEGESLLSQLGAIRGVNKALTGVPRN